MRFQRSDACYARARVIGVSFTVKYFAGIIAVLFLSYWLYLPTYNNVLKDVLFLESGLPASVKVLAYHNAYSFQDPADQWLLEIKEGEFEKILAGREYATCEENVLNSQSSKRFGKEHTVFELKYCYTNWSGKDNRLLTEIYADKTKEKAIVTSSHW